MQGYNLKDYSPMMQSDMGDFTQASAASILFWDSLIFQTPEFYFNCPPLCCLHMKLDAAAGKALPPTAASPKEMGKHTRTQTASSLPSAAVNEWGCCCQVSCEFETAAERTHCALTTQSGTAAARLPGTTGSIWHTDDFTHTDTRWKIVGQNHGRHLDVVWNWKPIFNWDLNSPGCRGK